MTMIGHVPVKYPAPQMNSSWAFEHDIHDPLQQFSNWNSLLSNPSNNYSNKNAQVSKITSPSGHIAAQHQY